MNKKLPVNNINKVKREYPNKNNIEGSNKQPDNMLSMLQIFFSGKKILTDEIKILFLFYHQFLRLQSQQFSLH